MTTDEKLDAILTEQTKQGKDIATLVERSKQQEKRIEQAEKDCRSAAKRTGLASGSGAGTIGGLIGGFLASLLGLGHGS